MSKGGSISRISLLSERSDIITFVRTVFGSVIPITVINSLADASISLFSLTIIDASIFSCCSDDLLCYAETCTEYSICLIPSNTHKQIMDYIERKFRYIIPYPIKSEYFRDYCFRTINLINACKEECMPRLSNEDAIPESISGYFCGDSKLIKNVRKQILMAAGSREPVLILGETGTGKTTAARIIHALSERKHKKMISVSLSTVVESLAESTFFGHVRGSFTNADHDEKGCFESADGSTLFMDELGTASLSMQSMLLTVLETGNFKKVGVDREQHADVRMIFATNADIPKMLNDGSFRSDLYFRIYDNTIKLPPLRERKEDLREMVNNYLDKKSVLVSEDALEEIEDYSWPGNIRELHKCLQRALRNAENGVITADLLDFGEINFPL